MHIFRTLGYFFAAGLLVLAGVVILFSDATVPDASGVPPDNNQADVQPAPRPHVLPAPGPRPSPKPSPAPLPQGDDLTSARTRSEATGRPLLVLFGATWCAPCQLVHNELLPALRAKGELAIIDVDEYPAIYKQTCPGWPVPALVVYNRTGNTWSLAGSCMSYDQIKVYATQVGAAPFQEPTWAPGKPVGRLRAMFKATMVVPGVQGDVVASAECCPGGNCQQPGDNAAVVFKGRWR